MSASSDIRKIYIKITQQKGLNQKVYTLFCGDCQGKRWGEVEKSVGGINGDAQRFDLGW